MFGSLNGQLAAGVEMDDLWHAVERAAVLAQDVLVLLRPGQLHVHEALAAPEDTSKHTRVLFFYFFLSCLVFLNPGLSRTATANLK